MAFKPNYNMQRAERNRAKQAKQEEKKREQQEQVARRKAAIARGEADPGGPDEIEGTEPPDAPEEPQV